MKSITERVHLAKVNVTDPDQVIPYLGGDFQIVKAECWEQVAFAALLALRAFERGTNHAKTLGGELLLRLAGTLQIKDAISKIGAKKGKNYMVFFGNEKTAKEKLKRLGLIELPIADCEKEKLKTFFEKAALIEVL